MMDFKSFLILSVKSAMTLYKLFIQFSPVGTGIGPYSGVIAKGTLLDKRCASIGPIGKFFAWPGPRNPPSPLTPTPHKQTHTQTQAHTCTPEMAQCLRGCVHAWVFHPVVL